MDNDTIRRLEKGREHYENREYDKAEPYLLKVVEVEDRFADVMNMLGVIYHDKGQVALAQEYFEKAMRINPRYTEAALNLAVTCNEQGLYKKAKQIYNHITSQFADQKKEIEPFARGKLANMHAELGRAYNELQRHDKAITQYREALSMCPEFVDIRTRLGQTLKDMGALEDARVELELVKKMRPKYVPARISLGVTYFALGDKRAAGNEWKEVLELDPENKTADMYLKMVDQLLAQLEAEEAGMHLEIGQLEADQPDEEGAPEGKSDDAGEAGKDEDELEFTYETERSSVKPILPDVESTETPAGEETSEQAAEIQEAEAPEGDGNKAEK